MAKQFGMPHNMSYWLGFESWVPHKPQQKSVWLPFPVQSWFHMHDPFPLSFIDEMETVNMVMGKGSSGWISTYNAFIAYKIDML